MSASRAIRLSRARLYLIATPHALGPRWLETLETVLATGLVDMVQLRDKQSDDAEFERRAHRVRDACARADCLFLVNDRVHLAVSVGADGAHVGADDLRPEDARALLGDDRLLGVSTHDGDEVARAASRGADHAGLGPCHPSTSKALTYAPRGPDLLRRALPRAGALPVFPIGGITPANAGALVAAGARRLAVGAGVLAAPDPAQAAQELVRRLEAGWGPVPGPGHATGADRPEVC